jgi:hypothetical protein
MTAALVDNTTATLTGQVADPAEQRNACGVAWWRVVIDDKDRGPTDVQVYPYMGEAVRPLMVEGTRVTITGRVDAYMTPAPYVIAQTVTAA